MALWHKATFSGALHTRGVVLPDDSWVASGAGFVKNVLELFVSSGGRGKFKGEKVRGKNIAVNAIKLRNWKWLLLLLFYTEALLEAH